jgi:two-component system, NtrC family, sensor kinase
MQLARKITLPLAVAAFLALGFSAWLSVREAVALHHADIERDQSVAGRVFLAALERERAQGTAAAGAEALLAAANRDAQTQMRLVPLNEVTFTAEQHTSLDRGDPVFVLDVWHSAETLLATTLPDGRPGVLWAQEALGAERDTLGRIIKSHVVNFVSLGILWAVVAIGLGAVVVGRPMRSLAEKARRVSRGDYSGPLEIAQRDEIGELASEMNSMCDELMNASERLKQEVRARASAQDALRHADRLTTVGILAAGIAHELGTPLNVVSMRARMISTGEVQGDEVKKNAEIIHQQTGQMTRIIRQLLDFAGRRPAKMTQFSLDQVAAESVAMLHPLAEKGGCSLSVVPTEKVEIEGDANQIQQVIANLVINSVQAMPEGGPVTISVNKVRAQPPPDLGGQESAYARLDVKDQGSGIAPDVLPRIFEPFFTTKPVGDGNGLGLPVAWGILKDHRGWIAVDSKPGLGTTFSLFLPLDRLAA